jgi:signal transduction histidine kinase
MSARSEPDGLALLVHEVKSPVAAVSAIADAVAHDELDAGSVRDLLRLAIEACRGIERIVGEAALGSLRREVVDVAALVADATASAALLGVALRAEVGPAPILAAVDPVRLRQALDNLIVNAATHACVEDQIVVRATSSETTVVLSVSDRGRGIAFEDHARIFEPGVRLDGERPGSGLGLAIVRAIAEAHGGTLTLESAPGEGATFTISLPRERI